MDNVYVYVGFADVIITPKEPVPLAGFGNTSRRMHKNVLEDLHGLCTAISDEQGETVIFITTDTTRAYPTLAPELREKVSQKTGLPVERIMVTATHTHSGPDLLNLEEESIQRYLPELIDMLVQGASDALDDRKPATMYTGNVQTEGLNFVKHYKHVTSEGETKYFGDCFGTPVYDETTDHVTKADTTMHLIRFVRQGGKDVVLVNWRAHPQLTGGYAKFNMSADFLGPFRTILGAQLNCHVHYLQGASGNINPLSRLKYENYSSDHNVFGARLAYFALKGLENNMHQVSCGNIRNKRFFLHGQVNHSMDEKVEDARKVLRFWADVGDDKESFKLARSLGIDSPYAAMSYIAKSQLPAELDLELNAIAVGDSVAFVTAPNELFDTNSVYTETNSPFSMTFVCGYANDHVFYIPSKYGFEYRCYESQVCRFVPGTGEQISDYFLQMLNDLK